MISSTLFWIVLFLSTTAWAAVPEVSIQPEPADIQEQYRDFARQLGRSGLATEIACKTLAPEIELCLRFADSGRWRYVTQDELARWRQSLPQVLQQQTNKDIAQHFDAVENTEAGGVIWQSNDRRAFQLLLEPASVSQVVPDGSALVAVPRHDTLLIWKPGDAQRDRILAVAVRRMHDESDHPVSPLVYQAQGGRWAVWGRATVR